MTSYRIGFIMDPMEKVHVEDDTSVSLMLESQHRGWDVYYLLLNDLFVRSQEAMGRGTPVRVDLKSGFQVIGPVTTFPLRELDVVFIRKEPPFDMDYVFSTYILELAASKTFMVNDPKGLRDANEKLFILNFPEIIPPTCVAKDPEILKSFLASVKGEMVVKPLGGKGGEGVIYLHSGDRNLSALLELSTRSGTEYVMAQRYLPEILQGDKRVLILDGKPLGAFNRVPAAGELRGNIHAGGTCCKTSVTDRDRFICEVLDDSLRSHGLHFVGVDIIGGWVTEINVTSPAGIPEINGFEGTRLEADTLDFLEKRIKT
ncbi:MAG TPA: glutathione synthase [bacterium]|nr:glutathione synthase [bacterium]